ncbi:hypothetical protein BFV96_2414 [Alteromonas macleodii]|nr:hypothetical protein BFV96_2414 [Alteromonas macleodii]
MWLTDHWLTSFFTFLQTWAVSYSFLLEKVDDTAAITALFSNL